MGTNVRDVLPLRPTHPGYILVNELEARGISPEELAQSLSISRSYVAEILNGERDVTEDVARKLENVLGISYEMWLNVQNRYDEVIEKKAALARVQSDERDYHADNAHGDCRWTTVIADQLREGRRRAGLTQKQLAAQAGTQPTVISRLERGKADVKISTLERIFKHIGQHLAL